MRLGAAGWALPSAAASHVCWVATSRSRANPAAGRHSRCGFRRQDSQSAESAEQCAHRQGGEGRARPRRLTAEWRHLRDVPGRYHPALALVTEGGFTSLPDVGAARYPWVPVRYGMRNQFNNLQRARALAMPWIVFHGREDTDVPVLARRSTGGSGTRRAIDNAGCRPQRRRDRGPRVGAWRAPRNWPPCAMIPDVVRDEHLDFRRGLPVS